MRRFARSGKPRPRQSIILEWRPTVFDGDVLTLDVAGLVQTLPEGDETEIVGLWGSGAEIADHGHRLLCAGVDGPCDRHAAEQREDVTPFHSITSSARPSRVYGMVRPSALAV